MPSSPLGVYKPLALPLSIAIQEPIERVLGRRSELVNGRVVDISDCCYEVDLLASLQQQPSTRTVLEQVYMHAHMYTQMA